MTMQRADRHLRHVMAAVLAVTVAAVGAAAAQPPLPDTPEAFGAALKNWAARHKVAQAFVVVRRDGRIVHRSSVGGIDPTAPVHLASLSKAITGACVATLIRDGRLTFDTPVSSALAKFIARHGRLGDPRFARATVAQPRRRGRARPFWAGRSTSGWRAIRGRNSSTAIPAIWRSAP